MKTLKLHFFWPAAVLVLAGCADTGSNKSNLAAGTQRRLDSAMALINDKDIKNGEPALQAVIAEKGFAALPAEAQYQALLTAARGAVAHREFKLAYGYTTRMVARQDASFRDGQAQLYVALKPDNDVDQDVIDSVIVLFERWPSDASQIDEKFILRVVGEAKTRNNKSYFTLLSALYAAHWKLKGDFEPSWVWGALSGLLLQKGQLLRALDVSTHVTDPYDLIAMRADRRFDAIVAANPSQFDIVAAANRQLRAIELAAANSTRSLESKTAEISALEVRQRYDAMLAATDSIVAQVESTNFPEKLFDDYEKLYAAVLDRRAYALVQTGRWDDGIAQMEAASRRLEDGSANVDQTINLANIYCALRRPREALATLNRLTSKRSAFGYMQEEGIRLWAAVQLADKKQIAVSLAFLRKNHQQAPFTYEQSLVTAREFGRAAQFLVAILRNPATRQEALESVQNYPLALQPPEVLELDAAWRAVIARKEVQAAIREVGRIESYELESPMAFL